MEYRIEYAGICMRGLVRRRNEDNLWCGGACLPMRHPEEEYLFEGSVEESGPHFAVFDGMGGAKCGDAASYIAAEEFGRQVSRKGAGAALLCREMNRKVLGYADTHQARGMGTTVAALAFGPEDVRGFNVGDSRCYRLSEGGLTQLSVDHTTFSIFRKRDLLTQCIGIPESEFIPEPSFYSAPYRKGDIYLLCSDGLWGMADNRIIGKILSVAASSLEEKRDKLKAAVLAAGAADNMTALLFQIL